MNGAEPSGFVRSALPTRTLIAARELFNWLTFGDASNRDRVAELAAEMVEFWGYGPGRDGTSNEMLFALREMAGQLDQSDRNLLQACDTVPAWLVKAREQAASPAQVWAGVPSRAVVTLLERQLSTYRQAVAAIKSWSDQLLELAVSGKLAVIASPAAVVHPGLQPTAAGKAIRVPETDFATVGAHIDPSGVITVPCEAGYVHARFYTEQVRSLWEVTAPAELQLEEISSAPTSEADNPLTRASNWMRQNLTPSSKRLDMISQCKDLAKVTWRVAVQAWDALSPEEKGTRGKHK